MLIVRWIQNNAAPNSFLGEVFGALAALRNIARRMLGTSRRPRGRSDSGEQSEIELAANQLHLRSGPGGGAAVFLPEQFLNRTHAYFRLNHLSPFIGTAPPVFDGVFTVFWIDGKKRFRRCFQLFRKRSWFLPFRHPRFFDFLKDLRNIGRNIALKCALNNLILIYATRGLYRGSFHGLLRETNIVYY